MKAIAIILIACIVSLPLLITVPYSSSRGVSVFVRGTPPPLTAFTQHIQNLDWEAEVARTGTVLSPEQRANVVAAIQNAPFREVDPRVACQLEVNIRSGMIFNNNDAVPPLLDVIAARLQLESRIFTYADQPAEERRSDIWAAYGSGFDARTREWFQELQTTEENLEVRQFASELLAKLPSS